MRWSRAWSVFKVRAWFHLGWPGTLGLTLLLCAPVFAWQGWQSRLQRMVIIVPEAAMTSVETLQTNSATQSDYIRPPLARLVDAPELLKSLQQTSKAHGLAWPQAEYRYWPIQKDALAMMEIQTSVKGSYPQVKTWVQDLLKAQPSLAIRELTLERQNADIALVEAKIRWTMYLQDDWLQPSAEKQP